MVTTATPQSWKVFGSENSPATSLTQHVISGLETYELQYLMNKLPEKGIFGYEIRENSIILSGSVQVVSAAKLGVQSIRRDVVLSSLCGTPNGVDQEAFGEYLHNALSLGSTVLTAQGLDFHVFGKRICVDRAKEEVSRIKLQTISQDVPLKFLMDNQNLRKSLCRDYKVLMVMLPRPTKPLQIWGTDAAIQKFLEHFNHSKLCVVPQLVKQMSKFRHSYFKNLLKDRVSKYGFTKLHYEKTNFRVFGTEDAVNRAGTILKNEFSRLNEQVGFETSSFKVNEAESKLFRQHERGSITTAANNTGTWIDLKGDQVEITGISTYTDTRECRKLVFSIIGRNPQ